jgi:Ca2+-binding EF-hand superfamily protein
VTVARLRRNPDEEMVMMRTTPIILACAAVLALSACGEDAGLGAPADSGALVENAAFSAALADGDGEDLELASFDVPMTLAAEEDIEAMLDSDGDYAPNCSLTALKARIRDHYDHNGDGRLGPFELHELRVQFMERPARRHRFARHHRIARLRWIYDADGSGDLDESQLDEMRADLEVRCFNRHAYLIETYDEDGNGELDEDEWALAVEDLRARRSERRQAILDEFDENGDGQLDRDERLAAFAARRARIAERRAAIIEEFDEDGDGELNEDEKAALREVLKARVRGEHFLDDEEEAAA